MNENEILFNEINKFGPMGKDKLLDDIDSVPEEKSTSLEVALLIKEGAIFLRDFQRRKAFVERYSWAVPSEEAINEIVKFVGKDKVIEVGAGLGLWAKLLHGHNIRIRATDNYDKGWYKARNNFYPVRKVAYRRALKLYEKSEVLFLCWPPYNTPLAHHSLKMFNGNKFIYIGEHGGCNGDEPFFHLLKTQWKKIKRVSLIQWPLIHDEMYFYVRRVKRVRES